MDNVQKIPCPVCAAATVGYQNLSAEFIKRSLAGFYGVPVPDNVSIDAYEMRRCSECTLEFAHPPIPAADAFYNWMDRGGGYYIKERWEWDQVSKIIDEQQRSSRVDSVIEIGAGDAYFLRKIQDVTGARIVAIERSEQAASAVRKKGTEAYAEDIAPHPIDGQTFDFVLSFHCLEHVVDPVKFLKELCRWAGTKGRILFSVPYSPMYFEGLWFDPLNHPPHHLSRWNQRSLSKLAECVGGRAHFMMPKAYSVFLRARYALAIHYLGPHWYGRRLAKILPLLHPIRFGLEVLHQQKRDLVNGQPAADVVLVEVTREVR